MIGLAVAFAASAAMGAESYEGLWAPDAAWCANAGRIGEVREAPMRLTPTRMESYEGDCTVERIFRGPDLSAWWRFEMSCSGRNGASADKTRVLSVMLDGDTLYVLNEGEAKPLVACAAAIN